MKKLVLSTAMFLLVLAVTILSAQAQQLKALHQFDGSIPGDGAFPHAAVLRDSAGNLFGTTLDGGTGDGTVFEIDNLGVESILLAFDGPVSGSAPDSTLIRDQAGNLYGEAIEGGPGGAGVVFKLSPQGEQTILHAFQLVPHQDPAIPSGGLVMDRLGNLYGTTFSGGNSNIPKCPNGCGTIFRLDPAGNFQLLYQFKGGADGIEPFGPLVPDANGNLYGVARAGGGPCPDPDTPGNGCGTVFELSRNGKLIVLHDFRGLADGAIPQPGLVFNDAGDLFGITARGGTFEHGTAFKISKDGTYTVLHQFTASEGTNPNGSLVLDEAGNLYGTAPFNGFRHLGTVFQIRPNGKVTVLHTFHGDVDGGVPQAGLIRDANGILYGTTTMNLLDQRVQGGNVFEIIP